MRGLAPHHPGIDVVPLTPASRRATSRGTSVQIEMNDPAPSPSPSSPLAFAQQELAEIFGNIAAFWGFTRTQGRIYGLVFLSPVALTQAEIRERLDISTGSASMTLASLVHWGALRQRGRAYEAETDLWKVITGVFRRREREQVDDAIARLGNVLRTLRAIENPSPADRFVLTRVRRLEAFFRLGRRFLDAFVAQTPLHGLLTTIAQQAAKLRALSSEHDAPIGH